MLSNRWIGKANYVEFFRYTKFYQADAFQKIECHHTMFFCEEKRI